MVTVTFALKNFRSRERNFHIWGTFVLWREYVLERSFLGTKITWNFRPRERKSHGTFALIEKCTHPSRHSHSSRVQTQVTKPDLSSNCHVQLSHA